MKHQTQTLLGLLGAASILISMNTMSGCGNTRKSVGDATETTQVDSTRNDAASLDVGDTRSIGDARLDGTDEADNPVGLSADACGHLMPLQLVENPPSSAAPCIGPFFSDVFNCPSNPHEPGQFSWDESWAPYAYVAENFLCDENEDCVASDPGFECATVLSQLTGDLAHDTALMPGRCYSRCAIPCPVTDADLLWAKTALVLGEKCEEPWYQHKECWDEGVEEHEMQEAEFTSNQICDRARAYGCIGETSSCAPGNSCIAKLIGIFYWDHPVPDKLSKWVGVCIPGAD